MISPDNDSFTKQILLLDNKICLENLINFIKNKRESKSDEAVYLDELNRLDLSFEDIKQQVLNKINNYQFL